LFLACLHVFVVNSGPVWNLLFNLSVDKPEPYMLHYNVWQGGLAIFVAFFIGFTQFLKYRKTDFGKFIKNISISFIISVCLTLIGFFVMDFSKQYDLPGRIIDDIQPAIFVLLLFASIYAIVGNVDYLIRFSKGKLNVSGASIAHIGFGMILLGALISNSQSEKLSNNKSGKFDLAALSDDFKNDEDAQITIGDTVDINGYFVRFKKRYQKDINVYYEMDYFEKIKEGDSYRVGDSLFTLHPFVQLNEQFGNAAEPSTKHYLLHDIFTFIKYPNPSMFEGQNNGYMPFERFEMNVGDTIRFGEGYLYAKDLIIKPYNEDVAGAAVVELLDFKRNSKKSINLIFTIVNDTNLIPAPAEMPNGENFKLGLTGIQRADTTRNKPAKLAVDISEREFVVVQAKTFPLINILWLGIVIMFLGTLMSVVHRFRNVIKH